MTDKDTRGTYKPNLKAREWLEVIKEEHPGLDGLSAVINYAIKATTLEILEKREVAK